MNQNDLRPQLVALMTAHQRSIYGYIVSLLGSQAEADDVLQNTYLAIWRKADEFHGRGQFMTWACRIAHFEVLAHRKKARRGATVGFDGPMLDKIAAAAQDVLAGADGRVSALRECMHELDDPAARLLQMRYGQDLTPQQISEQAGRQNAGAIRVALFRIRKTLLDCIRGKLAEEAVE
ncbi:MAG: sigma-70 family RNA polymerase sigma factor [Planctomycetes bacterium]|nr:sigma-70 family RNA polymerase sigma factor [Planctomycetota bacterium]